MDGRQLALHPHHGPGVQAWRHRQEHLLGVHPLDGGGALVRALLRADRLLGQLGDPHVCRAEEQVELQADAGGDAQPIELKDNYFIHLMHRYPP